MRSFDRPAERAERRKSHIADLPKRAAEADAKLKRLYDAIENDVADLSDPLLKDGLNELKAARDQARLDAERAGNAIDCIAPIITPQALKTFTETARKRMRTENGGYRCDHLRALAQRIEVDQKNCASWDRKAPFCVRSSLLQAQNGEFWRAQFCTKATSRWRFETSSIFNHSYTDMTNRSQG